MRAYNMKNNKLGVRAEHIFLTASSRDWFHMLLPCTYHWYIFLCVFVWVGFQTSVAFCTADTKCPPTNFHRADRAAKTFVPCPEEGR